MKGAVEAEGSEKTHIGINKESESGLKNKSKQGSNNVNIISPGGYAQDDQSFEGQGKPNRNTTADPNGQRLLC